MVMQQTLSDGEIGKAGGVQHGAWSELLTRQRWIEIGRIILTGFVILLYWRGLVPVWCLWAAVAVGLYPLVKTGVLDMVHERKIGTEIFVTIATLVALVGGEKISVDGRIVSGGGSVNEAPITGESVPKDKGEGDEVFAGTVLESGALDVRTERVGSDTTVARIVKLVEEAEESQAPVQRLADRVAAWLIPVVLVFLVVVFLVTRDVRKIVTLMIFTSPAELGLATPMVMIAAVARAARNGVLVKGGAHLERLAKVDAIVFDKTGTLTVGRPRVQKIIVLGG